MRTIARLYLILSLLAAPLFSPALIVTTAIVVCGCSTTGKTLATIATTADKAMEGWATYVVINKVPEADQAPVRAAYAKYQASMQVASSLYQQSAGKDTPALESAAKVLRDNQWALINLIESFKTRKATP